MQFDSLAFLVFFVLVVAGYYSLPGWTSRKVLLVAASYLFYAAWNPLYVLLLLASTLADWRIARRIGETPSKQGRRRLLTLSILINIGLLGYFKYGQFLLDAFTNFASALGMDYAPPNVEILLPVGISFYTFQTLSYTIDVYRGNVSPRWSLIDFALFVGFFPQLVAGPIVRASGFLPQCEKPKSFSPSSVGWGMALLSFGLFSKVVLADSILAPAADTVFDGPGKVEMLDAWLGLLSFSGQIYLDFSGYSLCAIGAALCLGFRLPDNFRAPYAAVGFSDFWRRWHISLSSWLRDYLYISLGGNRCSQLRVLFNLMATMLLGGLWHGASWMFVIWGVLHGGFLIVERALAGRVRTIMRNMPSLRAALAGAVTFLAVSLAWIFFRSPDLGTATELMGVLTGNTEGGFITFGDRIPLIAGTLAGLLIWHSLTRTTPAEARFARLPVWARAAVISVTLLAIIYSGNGNSHEFIYFQF